MIFRFFVFYSLFLGSTLSLAQEFENYLDLTAHKAEVQNLRFSPQGDVLASVSFDNTVMVWEISSSKLLHTLEGHSDAILEVSFSADSKLLATASKDGSVKIWDLNSGKLKSTFYNQPFLHQNGEVYKAVTFVVFSKNGKYIYFGGKSGYLMRAKTERTKEKPKEIHHVNANFGYFRTITGGCLSKDGKLFFISTGKSIRIISLQKGKLIKTLTYPDALLNDVILGAQDNMISCWAEDGNVIIWDYLKGEIVKKLKVTTGGKENYSVISYSKNNQLLVTGASQNNAKIWDWQSGNLIQTLEGHTRLVRACKFSPSQNIIATASYDYTIKLWKKQKKDSSTNSQNTELADNQYFTKNKKGDTVFVYQDKIIRDTVYIYSRDTVYIKESVKPSLAESDLRVDFTINLKGIRFERGNAIFLPEAFPELEVLYNLMTKKTNMRIELGGHTDNVGDKTLLFQLATDRIQKVKTYLISRGISQYRIETKAYGGTNPINTNNDEQSRRLNRRVEVTILQL